LVNSFLFQSHFCVKHTNQDDINVKPQHRVGQGLLQVSQEAQPDEEEQEQSSEYEHTPDDDDDTGPAEEDEEVFAQESYSALK
jgi:hypothetical protein